MTISEKENDLTAQVVSDPNEMPLVFHSHINTNISNYSFLRKSLLFAELSMIAYNDPNEAERAVNLIGFPISIFFDYDGAQGYFFENDHDAVIVCRGTEPHEWNDIHADANVGTVLAETTGRVHRGFKQEADDLWPLIEKHIQELDKTLWFTGHSLGAAMATICSYRCHNSDECANPVELYTYGSPRVGNKSYINYVNLNHYRWVNNNDIVTRVPPVWMGYRHTGTEMYLNRNGMLRSLSYGEKRLDRWHGFLRGLRKFRIDHFSDHSVHTYVTHILKAVKKEEGIKD